MGEEGLWDCIVTWACIARGRVAQDHGKKKVIFIEGKGALFFLNCFHFLAAISSQVEKLFP